MSRLAATDNNTITEPHKQHTDNEKKAGSTFGRTCPTPSTANSQMLIGSREWLTHKPTPALPRHNNRRHISTNCSKILDCPLIESDNSGTVSVWLRCRSLIPSQKIASLSNVVLLRPCSKNKNNRGRHKRRKASAANLHAVHQPDDVLREKSLGESPLRTQGMPCAHVLDEFQGQ